MMMQPRNLGHQPETPAGKRRGSGARGAAGLGSSRRGGASARRARGVGHQPETPAGKRRGSGARGAAGRARGAAGRARGGRGA